jgi:hypothetical protein
VRLGRFIVGQATHVGGIFPTGAKLKEQLDKRISSFLRLPQFGGYMVKQIVTTAFVLCALGISAVPQTHAETRLLNGAVGISGAIGIPPQRDLVTADVDANRLQTLPNHRAAWAVGGNESGVVPLEIPLQ